MKINRKSLAFVAMFVLTPLLLVWILGVKALPIIFAVGAFAAFLPHPWPIFSNASPDEVARMPRLTLPWRLLHFCLFSSLAIAMWFE